LLRPSDQDGVGWDDLTFNPPEFTEPAKTPAEQIQEILNFVNDSVASGTLIGKGTGKSGAQHLESIIEDLELVQVLIAIESFTRSLQTLDGVYQHCDGESSPPDWVEGDAASGLAEEIRTLQPLIVVAAIDKAKRTGTYVDAGFDVKRDGFTFANTGNLIPDDHWWWNWLEIQGAACLGMSAYAQTYYVEQVKDKSNPIHLADISDNEDYRVAVNQSQWTTALGNFWQVFWSILTPWPSHKETIEGIMSEMYKTQNPVVVLLENSAKEGHAILDPIQA
jgi:hypothetical protein